MVAVFDSRWIRAIEENYWEILTEIVSSSKRYSNEAVLKIFQYIDDISSNQHYAGGEKLFRACLKILIATAEGIRKSRMSIDKIKDKLLNLIEFSNFNYDIVCKNQKNEDFIKSNYFISSIIFQQGSLEVNYFRFKNLINKLLFSIISKICEESELFLDLISINLFNNCLTNTFIDWRYLLSTESPSNSNNEEVKDIKPWKDSEEISQGI